MRNSEESLNQKQMKILLKPTDVDSGPLSEMARGLFLVHRDMRAMKTDRERKLQYAMTPNWSFVGFGIQDQNDLAATFSQLSLEVQ